MADKDQGKGKKGKPMPLHAFLETNDDGGSWADRSEDIDPSDRPAPRGGGGGGGGGDYERSERYSDRGGDRYGDRGGDRYGDRGGDRYGGGDRYDRGGDRGGDRYGDRGGYGGDRYGDRGGRGGYGDRGGYRERYEDRPPRQQKPVPENGPFIAYVGNLSFNISEDDLFGFFQEGGCKVKTTRIVMDFNERSKGFGYVEFEDKASLELGLDANDIEFAGRRIRVDVADAERSSTKSRSDGGDRWERGRAVERSEDDRDDRRGDRDRGGRGGYRRGGDRGGYGGGGDRYGGGGAVGGGYNRGGYRDNNESGPPRDRAERGRPTVNLTRNVEAAPDKKSGGSNPFGSATPIVSKADKIMQEKAAAEAAAAEAAAAAAAEAGDKAPESSETKEADATANKFEALKLAEEESNE